MPYGGGTFLTQNKLEPGVFINFVSKDTARATVGDRGVVAMPIELDWGISGSVFTVESSDFESGCLKTFGYLSTADEMKWARDLFANAKKVYFYRVNTGGSVAGAAVKAQSAIGTAKYYGTRGNSLKIGVRTNEGWTIENNLCDVRVTFDDIEVFYQAGVTSTTNLSACDYVDWTASVALSSYLGSSMGRYNDTPLTGGANLAAVLSTVANSNYQAALDAFESVNFNVLAYAPYSWYRYTAEGATNNNTIIKDLFATYTRRMRDDVGKKFQFVTHDYAAADYEGVISVENNLTGEAGTSTAPYSGNLVYWVAGAEAGCAINASCVNKKYDGEYSINCDYTNAAFRTMLAAGKFVFHKTGDNVRVMRDINTLTSYTTAKGEDFASNQTIRVIDALAMDIAAMFATYYLGTAQNDDTGRSMLAGDIVAYIRKLENLRAVEAFDEDALTVAEGETARSVVVNISELDIVNAMEQLYMTVVVA